MPAERGTDLTEDAGSKRGWRAEEGTEGFPETRPWIAPEPASESIQEKKGAVLPSLIRDADVRDFAGRVLSRLRMTPAPSTPAETAAEPSAAVEYVGGGIAVRPGDVLAASRLGGVYQHFAVYIGGGRLIHYAAENGDFGGRISIHEADYASFSNGAADVCVIDFPDNNGILTGPLLPGHVPAAAVSESAVFDAVRSAFYHLYTPAETIARARSRLGEENYSLPFNNCEHFAVWCKTGVHESHQVNRWMTLLGRWVASAHRGR